MCQTVKNGSIEFFKRYFFNLFESKREFSLAALLAKGTQQSEMGQAKASDLELCLGLLHGW